VGLRTGGSKASSGEAAGPALAGEVGGELRQAVRERVHTAAICQPMVTISPLAYDETCWTCDNSWAD
jgi:hypothetical protein